MRKAYIRSSLLLLLCMILLAPHADTQASGQVSSQQPRQLYGVRNKEGKIGFIDKTGKLVIGFDRLPAGVVVGDFSEGLAPICFKDESGGGCRGVGFIDETGKIVIAPRFKQAGRFSEGLAYVRTKEGAGFINRRGEVVIKLKVFGVHEFHEGLAAVEIGPGWGFIDRTGKLVTKQQYSRAENFSEGLAAVSVGLGSTGAKYGFINKDGEVVIPLRFDPPLGRHKAIQYLGCFSEGLARVKVDKLYGYIDRKGEFVIKPQFHDADEFSEGLARVQMEDGKTGYIDKSGRLIIALGAVGSDDFKEGLAAIGVETERGTKWGYIDRTGKVIIEPRFNSAFEFVDGVAQVYFEEVVVSASGRLLVTKSGYIDRTGKYLWQPQ